MSWMLHRQLLFVHVALLAPCVDAVLWSSRAYDSGTRDKSTGAFASAQVELGGEQSHAAVANVPAANATAADATAAIATAAGVATAADAAAADATAAAACRKLLSRLGAEGAVDEALDPDWTALGCPSVMLRGAHPLKPADPYHPVCAHLCTPTPLVLQGVGVLPSCL